MSFKLPRAWQVVADMREPDQQARLNPSGGGPARVAVIVVCRNALLALRRTVESVLGHCESRPMLLEVAPLV